LPEVVYDRIFTRYLFFEIPDIVRTESVQAIASISSPIRLIKSKIYQTAFMSTRLFVGAQILVIDGGCVEAAAHLLFFERRHRSPLMQRLVRIHCRGAPSSRIRQNLSPFSPPRLRPPSNSIAGTRLLYRRPFTCQNDTVTSSPRFSFRHKTPYRFLIGVTSAVTIPIVAQSLEGDARQEQEDDLTLEQHLLDTSEEERQDQTYGVNKEQSIFYRCCRRIKIVFLRYIYEPIATGLRFIQLVFIFVPVFVTIPVVYIGARDPERDNERRGTLWWYSFLVRQMERAGATFIKVIHCNLQC